MAILLVRQRYRRAPRRATFVTVVSCCTPFAWGNRVVFRREATQQRRAKSGRANMIVGSEDTNQPDPFWSPPLILLSCLPSKNPSSVSRNPLFKPPILANSQKILNGPANVCCSRLVVGYKLEVNTPKSEDESMTETAAQLLATFELLKPEEKHQLLTEMLRRSGELPDTFLSDDDFIRFADGLFQTLDAEESNAPRQHTK